MNLIEVIQIILIFSAPVAAFVGGWALFTTGRCLFAALKRQPIAPVFKEMLEEW